MKYPAWAAAIAVGLFCSIATTAGAAGKHSHAAEARAKHLARLAAQEKAAWHLHLAKVRQLPHKERVALKHHDRRLVAQQQQQVQAKSLAHLAQAEKSAWRAHLARVAELGSKQRRAMRRHDAHLAALVAAHTATPSKPHRVQVAARRPRLSPKAAAHQAHVAALLAAGQALHAKRLTAQNHVLAQRLAAHNNKMAQRLAANQSALAQRQAAHRNAIMQHEARLAGAQAAHLARVAAAQRALTQRALNHQLRVAKDQASHNARLAAQRAHWVALHGDGSGGRSIKFWQTEAVGVPVKCITVDLNDSNVKVSAVMSQRGNGTAEPFRQMIARANPNVAVTGTFFSLDNLYPVGDIVIDGDLVHFGGMGTALCITPDNQAHMVTCEWGRHHDWSPYDFVVACGPRLLSHGQVVLDPHAERFRDQHMLAPNSRIAVGITRGNKVVFVMTRKPIYLGRLAKVMRAVGASEAMNLDAGTSEGFYYNGATLAQPGRKLTNMIVVYGHKENYERALDQLIPSAYRHERYRFSHRQVSALVRE